MSEYGEGCSKQPASSTTSLLPSRPHLSFTKRAIVFSVAVFSIFAQYLYFTVPMAFLANEILEKRNRSPMIAGTVFSALCLSLFFTLITAPKTSTFISIRQAILICIALSTLSTVFYVIKLDDTTWIVYSVVSRILQGIAIGITDVRFLDMMSQSFPDNVALVTSAYELSFSFCMMAGFEMGGFFYENFGFWAPLNITTVLVVVSCVAAYFCTFWLNGNESDASDVTPDSKDVLYWPILVLSLFVMGSVSITDSIAISFFSNYMLHEWETSETNSGWMMTVASLFYTASTFLSGFIGSKRKNLKYLLVGGLTLMGTSSCFLGKDVPGLQKMGIFFPAAINCILQTGSGFTQVAALPLMIAHYKHRTGLSENVASCHMGGIYSSSFFLGSFLGPLCGGFIIHVSSYGLSCTICGILLLVSVQIVMALHLTSRTLLNPWWASCGLSQDICDN